MSNDASTLTPTITDVRDLLRTLPTAATSKADRVAWLARKREMLAAIEACEATSGPPSSTA